MNPYKDTRTWIILLEKHLEYPVFKVVNPWLQNRPWSICRSDERHQECPRAWGVVLAVQDPGGRDTGSSEDGRGQGAPSYDDGTRQAEGCHTTAYCILKDNLEKQVQESFSWSRWIVRQKCFNWFVVSRMQRVHFVKATYRSRRMALRECFLRLVMWRMQRVQSVKLSVKATLRSRWTALQNCLEQWETWRLQHVLSTEAGLQCVLFTKASDWNCLISPKKSASVPLDYRLSGVQEDCIHTAPDRWFPCKRTLLAARLSAVLFSEENLPDFRLNSGEIQANSPEVRRKSPEVRRIQAKSPESCLKTGETRLKFRRKTGTLSPEFRRKLPKFRRKLPEFRRK